MKEVTDVLGVGHLRGRVVCVGRGQGRRRRPRLESVVDAVGGAPVGRVVAAVAVTEAVGANGRVGGQLGGRHRARLQRPRLGRRRAAWSRLL